MKRKILIGSILAVLMLITITLSTSVSSNTTEITETKESPLWGVRTRIAIGEKIGRIMENIKASFISEERMFFAPLLQNIADRNDYELATVFTLLCPCTIGFPFSCILKFVPL